MKRSRTLDVRYHMMAREKERALTLSAVQPKNSGALANELSHNIIPGAVPPHQLLQAYV